MKRNFLLAALLLLSLLGSCKKDKDDDNTVKDDPRIRAMSINGISTTFVVNDIDGEIYNYDSLSYGTNISDLHPIFNGYASLSYQYKYGNGEWIAYSDTAKLKLTSDISVKAIALDSNYTKEYKIKIRVHKYDVEAFTWEKSSLSVKGEVVSQKAVFFDQKYYFFYRNKSGKSYLLVSENGDDWTEKAEINLDNPDWATLTQMYQSSFAVQAADGLYVWNGDTDFSFSEVALPEGSSLQVPLFTLENKFWIIAKTGEGNYSLCYLTEEEETYQEKAQFPSDFSIEKITAFTAPSGSTTIGYILNGSGTDENTTVWAVDVSGNRIILSAGQSTFSLRKYPIPLFFGNKLYIAGGKTVDGSYSYEFYGSSDSGISWSKDTHKVLPEKIPNMGGSVFEYGRNRIILIGGENKDGFLPNVWKGTLNQELLDETMYK